jgi:phospholipid/cholesterol/gamma-HCH transport system permease protein
MTTSAQPTNRGFTLQGPEKNELTVYLHGRIDVKTAAHLLKQLKNEIKTKTFSSLTVDLDDLTYFDDYGALVLLSLKKHLKSNTRTGKFKVIDHHQKAKKILTVVEFEKQEDLAPLKQTQKSNFIVLLGKSTIELTSNLKYLISFLGSFILAFTQVLSHLKSIRFRDTIRCMEKTGVNALPIVGLISFLLGLVIAFMSSVQLKQFGANIYVASLVAVAMVSELGPIMTAIVVAGRTGSAFAAEIGTMKISEEIDALTTMGFNPIVFLGVPRVIAAFIVVPLLTLFSDVFAITGGLIVGVFLLDLTLSSYLAQTMKALSLFEVNWGLSKSLVFAIIVAWVGCLRGFQTRGGADAVGNAATSAVVTSIFLIILFDSIFAVARSLWR